jgi:hypothetical protein
LNRTASVCISTRRSKRFHTRHASHATTGMFLPLVHSTSTASVRSSDGNERMRLVSHVSSFSEEIFRTHSASAKPGQFEYEFGRSYSASAVVLAAFGVSLGQISVWVLHKRWATRPRQPGWPIGTPTKTSQKQKCHGRSGRVQGLDSQTRHV